MRFDNDGDQSNIEDRRGQGGGGGGGGRGRMGVPLGLGGTVVVLALSLLFKRNLFNEMGGSPPHAPAHRQPTGERVRGAPTGARAAGEEELKRIAIAAFNDAQKVWSQALRGRGETYRTARMVLFWDQTRSGCGAAAAQMGPFYCPADDRVYIDLGFYRELARRFGAPGDFAQAYVIAHELGHHIQNVLGIEERVRRAQRRSPQQRNQLSILMELQADCFAGVWGHSAQARGLLETGDVEEGLGAAAAVGDDRIQKASTGRVSPESWTHGSAAQRKRWFQTGLTSGRVADCDTFNGAVGPL